MIANECFKRMIVCCSVLVPTVYSVDVTEEGILNTSVYFSVQFLGGMWGKYTVEVLESCTFINSITALLSVVLFGMHATWFVR